MYVYNSFISKRLSNQNVTLISCVPATALEGSLFFLPKTGINFLPKKDILVSWLSIVLQQAHNTHSYPYPLSYLGAQLCWTQTDSVLSNENLKESGFSPVMSIMYLGFVLFLPTKFHPDLSTLSVPSKYQISLRSDHSFGS